MDTASLPEGFTSLPLSKEPHFVIHSNSLRVIINRILERLSLDWRIERSLQLEIALVAIGRENDE